MTARAGQPEPAEGSAGWTETDEVTRWLLTEQHPPQPRPTTLVEALLTAHDLIGELSQIAMGSGREQEFAELQGRRARLAAAGLDLAATAPPAEARALAEHARAAAADWRAAQDRVERLENGWAPDREEPPTHTLLYQAPLNHMSGQLGTWKLVAGTGGEPLGELLASPYVDVELLMTWARATLRGLVVSRVHQGIPIGMIELDHEGDAVFHLYAEPEPVIPF